MNFDNVKENIETTLKQIDYFEMLIKSNIKKYKYDENIIDRYIEILECKTTLVLYLNHLKQTLENTADKVNECFTLLCKIENSLKGIFDEC